MANGTKRAYVTVPDSARPELDALGENWRDVFRALESELEAEQSERTATYDFEGRQYFLTTLSTGQIAMYRPLTAEEGSEREADTDPSFMFIGFADPNDTTVKERMTSLDG